MQLDLSEKTALVTGASAGLGAAIARSLAGEGVRLAITARREDGLRQLEAELNAPVVLIPADITDRTAVMRIAETASAQLGRVDILVNCAGASSPITLDSDDALWDEAFTLNFTSVRQLSQRLVPGMRSRGWGRIINISGTAEPRDLNAAGAAKGALQIWAKGLASMVAKDGVTVNTIAPGRLWSEQIRERLHPDAEERAAFIGANIPLGRFGEPEELAVLATFLASPVASYITGAVIPVDGGMRRSAQ